MAAAAELRFVGFLIFLVFFILIGFCNAEDQRFLNCSRNFSCGAREIGYPFWGGERPSECGVSQLKLWCWRWNITTIDIAGQSFRVLSIHKNLMKIARNESLEDICEDRFTSALWSVDWNSGGDLKLQNSRDVEKLYLLYSCYSIDLPQKNIFNCSSNRANKINYAVNESLFHSLNFHGKTRCERNVTVPVMKAALQELPVNRSATSTALAGVVNVGFEVEYQMNSGTGCQVCEQSDGLCWSGTTSEPNHTCLCRNGPQPLFCSHKGNVLNVQRKIGIGFGAAAFTAMIMCIIFFIHHWRYKKRYVVSSFVSHGSSSHPQLTRELEKIGIHLFTYHELAEATDHFNLERELGDGGYGVVYKGKLQDGRTVAVKRLHEYHYKRAEQFVNEVEILSRLRHQNLVSLYGCASDNANELLLVYEYIPNGMLADHLHGTLASPGTPSWNTRLNIAIETASALAYLHASDVIHRDVKSTNILLDNNFSVKLADFGISRVLPADATHVSTAPQGTMGYVDPEYCEFYQLTEKSDVYSFGVLLMELISSKPAVDITRDRNEINLATLAIGKIQRHAVHELVDPHLGFKSDYRVRMMVGEVAELGFQCLQMGRDVRPHMQDVLASLQEILNRDYNRIDVVDIAADDVLMVKE